MYCSYTLLLLLPGRSGLFFLAVYYVTRKIIGCHVFLLKAQRPHAHVNNRFLFHEAPVKELDISPALEQNKAQGRFVFCNSPSANTQLVQSRLYQHIQGQKQNNGFGGRVKCMCPHASECLWGASCGQDCVSVYLHSCTLHKSTQVKGALHWFLLQESDEHPGERP